MTTEAATRAAEANAQLEAVYSARFDEWKTLRKQQWEKGRLLSIPCLLKATPAYFAAPIKVLFVGQETHGWWTERDLHDPLTVGQVMDFYAGIGRELQLHYRGAYWPALRYVAEGLQIDDPPQSFLFSNLMPCDVDKIQAPGELQETLQKWAFLPNEIRILSPDWIIFFCGPLYIWSLRAYFGEETQGLTRANPIVPYQPAGHAWRALITYHPNGLRWLKQLRPVLKQIVEKIEQSE